MKLIQIRIALFSYGVGVRVGVAQNGKVSG